MAVIVNPANSLRMLTIPQIRHLLSAKGDGTRWQELNGSGGTIECYGLKGQDASRYVLRQACMMLGPKYPTGYLNFRKDLHELDSVDEVASKIRADRNGVGFVLYNGQDLRGVKLVPIAADAKSQAVLPGEGEIIVEDYPLADMLVLNLKPGGDEAAKVFCRFCIGEKGAEIVASLGFVPPLHHAHIVGQKRVSEMKAGRGVRLSVMGTGDGRDAFQGLAMEYVRAKAVVQLSYAAVDSDVFSIGVFVNGEGASVRELLVLGDKPSSRAMELHGETWNSLGVDRDGKPDGTGPKEHMIAGRAAAIIVNPANKIESLTLGQIQAIFQGDVDDWAIVGGTELTPPTGPGGGSAALTAGRPGTLDIHAFGLYAREPATAIFEKEAVPRNKWKQVKYKKDTAEAVAAVSMDPQAIAFVDLTAIPASGQSVKILPIKFGQGEKARNIAPTAENIRSAMYPLSQRYFLYVHPKASDTAKDFARFIATCGGSEAMPYADTVKAMMETYQKHGLIPLADEAITRAAKDAMAEAARSTSSGQARSASSGQARSASSGQARSASSGQAAKTKAEEAAKGKAALR
ncbi:MAG: hypothetical protein GVY16_11585 [Planctomycetes bacterium]|nr:hypothetical protein [Planctomycetota bacterium]